MNLLFFFIYNPLLGYQPSSFSTNGNQYIRKKLLKIQKGWQKTSFAPSLRSNKRVRFKKEDQEEKEDSNELRLKESV